MASAAPHRRYRLLSTLLAPPLLAHLLWRGARDGGRRYIAERLGFGTGRPQGTDAARVGAGRADGAGGGAAQRRWVHAASVGELLTVLPLIEAVRAADGANAPPLLVTTSTPTAARVLAGRAVAGVRHRYLPVDRPGATARFLARERPDAGWIVETEIWPWLYARCRRAGVPLTIVNARLSPRTLEHARGALAPIWRRALEGVTVLARSEADARAYRSLGAEPERVAVVGELKLAATDDADAPPPPAPIERRYALAASTHEDEELGLARAWLEGGPAGLLVIAPRHPERGAALAARLAALAREHDDGVASVARRARGERPAAGARLYLADTLGELDAWYAHAAAAFVGGSLIARGGHNVLEPARRGCPLVVGPHTGNFAEAMALLRRADAVAERDDAAAVAAWLRRALAGDRALAAQGERGRAAARDAGDIVGRYLAPLLGRGVPGQADPSS